MSRLERLARLAAVLSVGYFLVYAPFAYYIRGAGAVHGELAVLPVYSLACAATLLVAMSILRRRLPAWRLSGRAWAAGAASTAVMYSSSAAYMNKAPPMLSAVGMKIGTLLIAIYLDHRAHPDRKPPVRPLVLAAGAILLGWAAQGVGPLLFTLSTLVAVIIYNIGWAGKMWLSAPYKGSLTFGIAEQVATAVCSVLVSLLLVLYQTYTQGFPYAAWTDPRVWTAGFFSQLTGMLATALVLLPAGHGLCMSASRGASLAAGGVAQYFRDGKLGPLEIASAVLAGWASVSAVKKTGASESHRHRDPSNVRNGLEPDLAATMAVTTGSTGSGQVVAARP